MDFCTEGGQVARPGSARHNDVPWPEFLLRIFEFRGKVPLLDFLQTLGRAGTLAWGVLWQFVVGLASLIEQSLTRDERPENSTVKFAQPQEASSN